MPQRGTLVLLIALLCGSGCFVQKRRDRVPLDPEALSRIEPGTTTMAKVAELMGAPNEIIWSNGVMTPVDLKGTTGVINTFLAQGEDTFARAYHYRYTLYKMSGFTVILFSTASHDTKYDDAYVFFDEKGVVTHVGASIDSEKASYSPFGS